MSSYVRKRHCGPDWRPRRPDGRLGHLGEIGMRLRHVRAPHDDADSVAPRITRLNIYSGLVIVIGVVISIRGRVFVRRRPVVMVGMIVVNVFVYVEEGGDSRRRDQGARKRDRNGTTHRISLLRHDPQKARIVCTIGTHPLRPVVYGVKAPL